MINKIIRILRITCLFLALGFLLSPHLALADDFEMPFHRIVIIYDRSGSFQESLESAWVKLEYLIKKYRFNQDDEISIIKLDEDPKVIFDGKGEYLKKAQTEFYALSHLSKGIGTDVCGAFQKAGRILSRTGSPQGKFLFVFSDLNADPSPKRQYIIPEQINWVNFQDVTIKAYYVDEQQEDLWSNLFKAHQISKYEFYSPARVTYQFIEPPAPATINYPQNTSLGKSFLGFICKAMLGLVLLVVGLSLIPFLQRMFRRPFIK